MEPKIQCLMSTISFLLLRLLLTAAKAAKKDSVAAEWPKAADDWLARPGGDSAGRRGATAAAGSVCGITLKG